jgi:hypothetical protein
MRSATARASLGVGLARISIRLPDAEVTAAIREALGVTGEAS